MAQHVLGGLFEDRQEQVSGLLDLTRIFEFFGLAVSFVYGAHKSTRIRGGLYGFAYACGIVTGLWITIVASPDELGEQDPNLILGFAYGSRAPRR